MISDLTLNIFNPTISCMRFHYGWVARGIRGRFSKGFLGWRRFFFSDAFTRSSLVFDESHEVPHVLELGQTVGRNTWGRRQAPWWQPGFHSGSSSWGRRRWWPRSCRATSCTPPWPTGGPWTYMFRGQILGIFSSSELHSIPGDECEAIWMVESLRDVLPKGVTCASRRDSPTTPATGE